MGSPSVLKLKYKCNQPSGGVLKKSCSENMLQIYRRTPMPKCDFNKVVSKHLFQEQLDGRQNTFFKNSWTAASESTYLQ